MLGTEDVVVFAIKELTALTGKADIIFEIAVEWMLANWGLVLRMVFIFLKDYRKKLWPTKPKIFTV